MHTIPAFGNHLPVKVRFGEGVSGNLPDVLAEVGASQVFLMVDEGIEQHNPAVAGLLAMLGGRPELTVTRFDKPAAEPTIEMVDSATRALVASGATALVAVGGGSVIDTAKAARLCAQLGMTFAEFLARSPGFPVPDAALVARAHQCRHRLRGVRRVRRLGSGSRDARTASPTPTCGPSTRWSTRCSPTPCRRP